MRANVSVTDGSSSTMSTVARCACDRSNGDAAASSERQATHGSASQNARPIAATVGDSAVGTPRHGVRDGTSSTALTAWSVSSHVLAVERYGIRVGKAADGYTNRDAA